MTRPRWVALAIVMGVSCVILFAVRDGLALAAAVMCVISVFQAAEAHS